MSCPFLASCGAPDVDKDEDRYDPEGDQDVQRYSDHIEFPIYSAGQCECPAEWECEEPPLEPAYWFPKVVRMHEHTRDDSRFRQLNSELPKAVMKYENTQNGPPPTKAVRKHGFPFPRIGIDLGGVLNQHNNDIVGDTSDWHLKKSSVAPGAMAAVKKLVTHFGPENVFIVSKLSQKMERLSETWLHQTMDICSRTGLLKENILFCRDCTGKKGKGPVAESLHLSHFVDDKDENLWSVFKDPAGNSRHAIKQHNGKLFHFARSGLGVSPPREDKWRQRPPCVVPVANWQQLRKGLGI
jgi:hypothetical protein